MFYDVKSYCLGMNENRRLSGGCNSRALYGWTDLRSSFLSGVTYVEEEFLFNREFPVKSFFFLRGRRWWTLVSFVMASENNIPGIYEICEFTTYIGNDYYAFFRIKFWFVFVCLFVFFVVSVKAVTAGGIQANLVTAEWLYDRCL